MLCRDGEKRGVTLHNWPSCLCLLPRSLGNLGTPVNSVCRICPEPSPTFCLPWALWAEGHVSASPSLSLGSGHPASFPATPTEGLCLCGFPNLEGSPHRQLCAALLFLESLLTSSYQSERPLGATPQKREAAPSPASRTPAPWPSFACSACTPTWRLEQLLSASLLRLQCNWL